MKPRLPPLGSVLLRPKLAAAAAFLIGLALAAAAARWQEADNAQQAAARFDGMAARAAEQVVNRMRIHEYGLRGARGAVIAAGGEGVSRALFRRYSESRDIEREFPGVRGMGVVRRVAAADEAAFVAAARLDGKPDFAIRGAAGPGTEPAAPAPARSDLYVIQYVEPVERNLAAIGFDIATEPHRRAAAVAAMRSGNATLSAPIKLVQTSGAGQRAFLLLLPIYRDGAPTRNSAEREAATFGWTFAPLEIDAALRDFDFQDGEFSLRLRDLSAEGSPVFFASPGSEGGEGRKGSKGSTTTATPWLRRIPIALYGRNWEAEVRATPAFVASMNQRSPRLVAAGGTGLAALLAVLAALYAVGRQQTLQVQAEQARRSALLESSADAIIGMTTGSIITDWNQGAERMLGHTAASAVGRDIRELILPEGHRPEHTTFMAAIMRGEAVLPFDTVRRHLDGHLVELSLAASAIVDATGRLLGVSKTYRDIGEAKRAERRVLELNASLEQQVLERTERLRASKALLDRAGSVAGIGGWELHLRSGVLTWSAQTYRIHELEPDHQPTIGTALDFYPPEARAVMEQAVATGIATGSGWDLELPFVTAKGRSIWVRGVGSAEFEDGQPVRLFGAFQDITARKEAEALLAHERHLMSSLLDTLPDQIYFKDRDSRFLRINPALARRYGLADPAQAVGKSDADFFTAEHARATAAVERRIVDSGEPVLDLEEQEFWPDRAPTWNLSTKMPLHDAQGRIVGTFGISRDISARKQIETQLQRTNERFALASDSAGIGVWEYDPHSQQLVWDDWMYRLYGHSPSTRIEPYSLWSESVHVDDRSHSERALVEALAGGRPFDLEFRIVRPGGEVRHLKAAARVLRDEQGQPLRMTGVNFDITERKRAELELIETSSLLRTMLGSASEVAIIATDPDLTIRIFNAGAERMSGYAAQDMVGRATPALLHDEEEVRVRGQELSAQLGRAIEGQGVFIDPATLRRPHEWSYIRQNGTRLSVSLVVTAMHADDGSLLGYLGVAHDVSRQKAYEASLRHAMRKAEQASLAKSQFLANMSHEIRTPMNAVIGLSYLLAQTPLDGQQADFLGKIRQASASLLGVINDVLDLSKIEAGELSVERAPFSLRTVLGQVHGVMAVQADAKQLGFEIDVPDELPNALIGDAMRLNQVLINLLANAIKFTDAGQVALRVQVAAQTAAGATLRFEVQDSGIGIAAEAQTRLFQPFAQADASTTRRFGGTGLGLSIVKRLARLMGGDAVLRSSTPGVGSVFHVELPFEAAAEDVPAFQDSALDAAVFDRLGGLRVLVVDDSEINLDVARHILELEGAEVSVARNGLEAFERLKANPQGCDLVLMDVQMPVLDGRDATRRIREELGLAQLPVIALTAGALTSERQSAIAAGMNDFISKPFDVATVVRSIRRLAGRSGDAARPAAERVQAAPAASAWPPIEGIDGGDVSERLGGDTALFAALLQRLLDEFGGGRAPHDAAGLHRLRGSAGTLGAKGIQALAGRAEQACRCGDAVRLRELGAELAAGLQALQAHAAPVLAALAPPAAADALSGPAAPDPVALAALAQALRRQSLSAMDGFSALSAQLRQLLGATGYAQAVEQLNGLQFVELADRLEAALAEL